MKRRLTYCILISLVLITPFIYSNDLYNGLISAKQIWFYGVMALLILVFCIELLFRRKNVSFSLNIIDISLLAFYTYFFIRTAFTPYTPLFFNTRFLNYTLLVLFYFVVKFTCTITRSAHEPGNNSSQNSGNKKQIVTPSEILTGFILLTGLAEALWGLLQLYGIKQSFHAGFKLTGTFYNPAPYALYLAAVFPLALGVYLFSKISDQDTMKFLKTVLNALIFYIKRIFHKDILTEQPGVYKISFNDLILRYLSLITFISILLVLPATMIRASWLAVLISGSLLIILRFKLNEKILKSLYSPVRKVLAVIFIIFFTGLSGTGLFYLKKRSSIGKLLIWEVTLGKIAEKPLFGHGVGRFEAEYNNWQAGYFKNHPEEMDGPKGIAAGNTKYCFNEYLEMASELGLIGLLFFMSVIASIFFGIHNEIITAQANDNRMTREAQMTAEGRMTINDVRSTNDTKPMTPAGQMTAQPNYARCANDARSANDAAGIMTCEAQMTFIILIPPFISLLVMALISFPFYSLPTLIVFFLLLAIISSHVKGISISKNIKWPPIIQRFPEVSTLSTLSTLSTPSTFIRRSFSVVGLSTFSTLSTISVLLLLLTRQQYKAYYTFDEAVNLYQTGSYEEACQSFSEVYDPLQYNGSYLQYYGKSLFLNEEYAKSKTMLERAGKLNTDEILYCSMGDCYKACKLYSEAEEAYQHASFMVPHKLYPLYLLAMLYDETGQREKAVAVAGKVLNKEIKVESEAREEIKNAMKAIIRKY